MRRAHLVLTALVLSTVLALTGCSGDSKSQASATPTAPARLDCSSLTIDTDSAALPQVGGDAAAAWFEADSAVIISTQGMGDDRLAQQAVVPIMGTLISRAPTLLDRAGYRTEPRPTPKSTSTPSPEPEPEPAPETTP